MAGIFCPSSAAQQCGNWPAQANEITSLGATRSEQKKQNVRPRGRSLVLFKLLSSEVLNSVA